MVNNFHNLSVMQKFKQQKAESSPQKVEKSVPFLYVYNVHQQASCQNEDGNVCPLGCMNIDANRCESHRFIVVNDPMMFHQNESLSA